MENAFLWLAILGCGLHALNQVMEMVDSISDGKACGVMVYSISAIGWLYIAVNIAPV